MKKEDWEKEFDVRFVVDLSEALKQALPESEGWEHGTNSRPFIRQMTESQELKSFISSLISQARKEAFKEALECVPTQDPTIFGGIINRGHSCYLAGVQARNELIGVIRAAIQKKMEEDNA